MAITLVFVGCQKPEETLETDRIETSTIEETTSQALQVPLEPKEGVPLSNLGKVAVRSIYTEPFEMLRILETLKYEFENGVLDRQKLAEKCEAVVAYITGTDDYYRYLPYLNVTLGDEISGVLPVENPIGGGNGYKDVITEGDFIVKTAEELVDAVGKAESGDVIFIAGDAKIDMTEYAYAENYIIKLKEGVTLASDRGYNGSLGGMIFSTAIRSAALIEAADNCRITGLTIQGPDPNIRDWKGMSIGIGVSIEGSSVTIDNCEISGFAKAAVAVEKGTDVVIKNCFIHDNKSINVGYGVMVTTGQALIESNLFNNNRTSIFGSGRPDCGIEVINNIEMGTVYERSIRMNTYPRGKDVYAGDSLIVKNNTVITKQTPLEIELIPVNGLEFSNNYIAGSDEDFESLMSLIQTEDPKIKATGNVFGFIYDIDDDEKEDISQYALKHTVEMQLTKITSRNIYGDMEKALKGVLSLIEKLNSRDIKDEEVSEDIVKMVRELEGYDRAYPYLEQPNMTIDGNVYGVIPDDQPLGGGYGYKEIFTTGDYIVETAAELRAALAKARKGEVVFVKGDAVIDLSAEKSSMIINDGVTLASDRGNGNSTGALIYSDSLISPLFTAGENVRITGLTFRGADPERRIEFHRRAFYVENAPGSTYYYKLKTLDCITTTKNKLHVDNCEFSGFSHAAIYVSGGLDHYFHHNYIHHNQRQGLGYGISHGTATSVIEYNLFNANRHDIAGTGAPGSGYIARHNIQMGTSLSHCFDMHGGADRNDGTDIAGDTILMYNNVFLSDQLPYAMRGTPQTVQRFYRNIVWPSLESLNQGRLYGRNEREKEKVEMTDNVFNAGIEPTVVP